MKALLRKELAPFLPPALIGALLLAALYALAFGIEDTLLAPPPQALAIAIVAALCMGALLGYAQLAVERHADTLSYLLHREQTPGRVLRAKVLAGWTLLGLVVHLPWVLFALWERWDSPLGAVLQWGRVGELEIAALACVPAHALGLFCGTLRCGIGWRTAILGVFVAGLGLLLTGFLLMPIAGPAESRWIYAGGLLVLGLLLLLCVAGELVRAEDAERPPRLRRIAAVGALALILVAQPVGVLLRMLQGRAVLFLVRDEPELLWHPEAGFVIATWEGERLVEAERPDGGPVNLVEQLRPEGRDWVSTIDLVAAGYRSLRTDRFSRIPALAPPTVLRPSSHRRTAPAITAHWREVGAVDFMDLGSHEAIGGAKAYLDEETARVWVLHASRWPHPSTKTGIVDFVESPRPTLRALVRGDDLPFSGHPLANVHEGSLSVLDVDGTAWSLDLGDPQSVFQRASAAAPEVKEPRQSSPASEEPLPRVEIDGDWLACSVRVIDRRSGELLLERAQGPLAEGRVHAGALLLLGSELLRPPATLLPGHFSSREPSLDRAEAFTGSHTSGGRRPLLAAAVVAFAWALAWRAERRLARRGAGFARRWGWALAIALLGVQAWLLFLALEPRALRTGSARAEPRRPLLAGEASAFG